ncbi:Type III secretion cytoplasmic LcrG inhibitor [Vibrio parahaemolyticus]|uniref:Type III secretion cytoplasmic LcrG inhibitor n=1 Tax=Vibrio parahaemolyticus TaxID=670 RepID=A0A9Q3UC81_VIBPH|nr:virulence-associated V antigen [Vibrio parahaemolyticus]EGQ8547120.1 Type III secretion cytoplasmic LcrG inhibitor [Vibrio parahaemolyticus]EGQ9070789.1 Type III secretion cytoplasmic LcrG inhibitor [Vibrio parahaemolyticus]EGQ9128677.1 Type III secretion cytoplasmic LcrG inhibitor [Vibrio parahaemolyticus]EHR5319823.1 Type III secretion cytoplasmic LcrG inhibitor [Vibrio parahaemolyticus]EIO3214731.1 Type III secretion cytoplasmic LcrG inhibitor [Vibrio parahaemolyticus]
MDMTNMTTTGSATGAATAAASSTPLPTFGQSLTEQLTPILGDAETQQLASLIAHLPTIKGQTDEQSIALYVDTLTQLKEKNSAFSGAALSESASIWMRSLQGASSSGEVDAAELTTQMNNALASQFQTWFADQLTDKVDSSLPTQFVSQFQLGNESTQAQQIAKLSAEELKSATGDIASFVDDLARQMSSSVVRESASSFLRNAFAHLPSMNLAQLKASDFLLTEANFVTNVSTQLQNAFNQIGITLTKDDADQLAKRITWTPGISKQQLSEALSEMATQVKGQFTAAYGETAGTENLRKALDAIIKSSDSLTLSSSFANFAVSLIHTEIDDFYSDKAIVDIQKTQISADQVELIKNNTERDIRFQFEKMLKGELTGASFIERYETLRKNLGALKDRLLNITEQEKKDLEVRAEHSLTARDLLAVVESSIGDRFDEQVLFALNERRVNRLEKRDQQKVELEELTTRLKIFGQVQSFMSTKLSEEVDSGISLVGGTVSSGGETWHTGHYRPQDVRFTYKDFGYDDQSSFENGKEFKYLEAHLSPNIDPKSGEKFFTHKQFIVDEGIAVTNDSYWKDDDLDRLGNFATSVSNKSKLLNDDVQLKTTELNDTSSQYNSTVEAMNKFVQKYHSILQEILRAI